VTSGTNEINTYLKKMATFERCNWHLFILVVFHILLDPEGKIKDNRKKLQTNLSDATSTTKTIEEDNQGDNSSKAAAKKKTRYPSEQANPRLRFFCQSYNREEWFIVYT
jgi:hypothetical protein